MKSPLSRYLAISLGATLGVASLGTLIANGYLARLALKRQIEHRAETIVHGLQFATEGLIEAQQTVLLERVVQNYATLPDVVQIEIVSPAGEILVSSPNDSRAETLWQPVRQQLLPVLEHCSQTGESIGMSFEQNSKSIFLQVLPFNSTLFYGQKQWGIVVVIIDLQPLKNEINRNFLLTASLSLAGIIFVVGGAVLIVRQRFLKPLQGLQGAIAAHSKQGELLIPPVLDDEIGFLADTLVQKFAELDTFVAELDQRVKLRTQELQESREFLQTLINYLPVALFVKDASAEGFGQFIFWNQASEEMFGLRADQTLGKTVYDLHNLAQATFFDLKDREAIASGNLVDISEEPIDSLSRGSILLHTIKVPLYDSQGSPKYLLCISEDITLRKQAETALHQLNLELEARVEERTQKLQESEARYRALMEGASDAILITDTNANVLEANQQALELLGYQREAITQLTIENLHPAAELGKIKEVFATILTHRSGKILDTLILRPDGQMIPVDITASLIEYNGQQLVQALLRDITEQKQVALEIQKSLAREQELNQLKSQFINIASHEFRSPLTVIIGLLQLISIQGNRLSPEKLRDYLQRIYDAALKMKELIDGVLTLSRIDSGKLNLDLHLVNLESFSLDLIEELKIGLGSNHNFSLVIKAENNSKNLVKLDPKLLRYIISNLLTNAVKYSPEFSEVKLIVEYGLKEIILQVTDEGMGIPIEDLPLIFESFHRGSNVQEIPGTGLGLNIVKRYVELQGGEIKVNSKINCGSTFTVRLPRKE